MDRRKFLLGLLGGLAAAPAAVMAAASRAEAGLSEPMAESMPLPIPSEADLDAVKSDWAQAGVRRLRRIERRARRRDVRVIRRQRRVVRRIRRRRGL